MFGQSGAAQAMFEIDTGPSRHTHVFGAHATAMLADLVAHTKPRRDVGFGNVNISYVEEYIFAVVADADDEAEAALRREVSYCTSAA